MKIEPNMYVRTDDGYINKIKKVNQYNVLVDARDLFGEELNIPNNEIIKASHKIIDLIEVGDYVNDFKVIGFRNDDGDYYLGIVVPDDDWADILPLSKITIYSIVTKEQFESMSYKLGDNK